MNFFKRYDKNIIEEFALRVISKSYDIDFDTYISPDNTNNFDFISVDGRKALEVTTVIPENEKQVYIYEKEFYGGKKQLKVDRIENVTLKKNGEIDNYYTLDVLPEIKNKVLSSVCNKNNIALKRKENACIDIIDLCVCIMDAGMYDINSFKINFTDFKDCIFRNIFFITSSRFICHNKELGFVEHERII